MDDVRIGRAAQFPLCSAEHTLAAHSGQGSRYCFAARCFHCASGAAAASLQAREYAAPGGRSSAWFKLIELALGPASVAGLRG